MAYRAPLDDYRQLLKHVVGYEAVADTQKYAEAGFETAEAILSGAAKVAQEMVAPLQRIGDLDPARLENGVVRTPKGFAEGYHAIAEGGWVAISAPEQYGGMDLPITLTTIVNEMISGACVSLNLTTLMSQGQIEALEHHASDAIKEMYIPKLISGEWCGTMNLTEPQAGSDVGALTTKAEENGDGTYAITGQKIYISGGDNDFASNICHLVLARLPGAPSGTKGISLFLVPKLIPDDNGNPAQPNSLKVVSLEHKLGLHGSATCVMQYDGAKGWLIGEEGGGMAAMFTMMNNARLGVGVQGLGVAEGAYQHALAYAMDRKQGRSETGTIIGHADVRRMLAGMKADIFVARSIALANAVAIDMAKATGSADWKARAALLTPITKAFGTDTGVDVASAGVQVHGGMGFIEETGAAQFLRDVRVTPIYEGTNGIQAMDLVGRKLMDGGEAAFALVDEIEGFAESVRGKAPDLGEPVWQACETLRETLETLLSMDMTDRFAGAVPFLRGFARVLGGYYHLRAALAEPDSATERLARFYITRILPEHMGLFAHAKAGSETLMALSPDDLAA
ncbi:acyl-CoA dehydrogenase [Thalassococcus lentus]|uniref:Acyl-CoA dehydrogenase n=1 Tax=Thalassococcus lentus TaxID=1210524 RepID=A0ABT4XSU6_9RHOB|nr:acyl-CoA dehydrogenase [Thalassococcus lentus]MDA7424970.1 acyl-CoA dehydrogenase [Thalassococcus lentus]